MGTTQTKGAAPQKGLYAPIDHDVMDSAAFADLSHSAVRVLLLVARQWSPPTNGKLQATFAYCRKRGIGSEHTMKQAVAELIEHGFLYRTRGHGIDAATGKNRPSLYAITWRPIKLALKPADMHLGGFVFEAFKKWQPEKKSGGQKLQPDGGKNCSFSLKTRQQKPPAISAVSATGKTSTETAQTADYEILAITRGISETPPIIRRGTYSNLLSVRNYPKKLH